MTIEEHSLFTVLVLIPLVNTPDADCMNHFVVVCDLSPTITVIVESSSSTLAGVETALHGEVDIPFVFDGRSLPAGSCGGGDGLRFRFDRTEADLYLPFELERLGSNPG